MPTKSTKPTPPTKTKRPATKKPGAKNASPVKDTSHLLGDENGNLRDIGDVWAEQRFISRQEFLLEEKQRKARAKRQRELGLVGRAQAALFGENAVKARKKNPTGKPVARKVEINISLPGRSYKRGTNTKDRTKRTTSNRPIRGRLQPSRLTIIRRKLVDLLATRPKLSAAVIGLALLAGTGAFLMTGFSGNKQQTTGSPDTEPSQAANSSTVSPLPQGTPEYKTILPAGKDIDDFGGWTRVSPKDKDPVFAYADKIGTIQINVSQQPLPEDLKTDDTEQQIEQLASSFSATHKITTNGATAYIGTSSKGPQSLIMAKGDLLVLIKSTAPLTDDQWVKYLSALR